MERGAGGRRGGGGGGGGGGGNINRKAFCKRKRQHGWVIGSVFLSDVFAGNFLVRSKLS